MIAKILDLLYQYTHQIQKAQTWHTETHFFELYKLGNRYLVRVYNLKPRASRFEWSEKRMIHESRKDIPFVTCDHAEAVKKSFRAFANHYKD